jgi:predicted nucleic acid-binding protein
MDRLFLDANVLFSAAYRPAAGLLRLWKLPGVVLCSSRYALEEARANLSTESQRSRLAELSAELELFESDGGALPAGVSLPAKDAPILRAAIAARATHQITRDLHDFGVLFSKKIAGLAILPPSDYLRRATSR